MLKLKPTLFLLAVLSLFSDRVSAAIEFRTLSVNEGLSQSTVLAIAQDGMGRIWMGTQDGLNCYDGYSFTVFRHVEGDAQSLGDNSVNALFADGGLLWIGTASGLSCYDAATQSFENFRLEGRNMQVADIAATAGGDLILATDLGIVLFDRASRELEIRTYLTGISVHAVCPSRDGFLVGTSNGVYTYSSTYGNAVRILPQMARYDIASIVADGDGYWVATHGNGLYRLDGALQVTARYDAASNPGLVSNYIRVLKTDSAGHLWIGTFDGLSIRDPRSGRFERYVHTSEPGSLSHNSIRSIFIDAQRGVWLGTYYGGVSYYHPLARRFGVLRHDPTRNSLGDNTVSCIVEDPSSQSLWIGTNDDGVNLYDRRTGRFSEFNTASGSLLSNNVKCVLPDGRGRVWIGTHAGGLSSMDAADAARPPLPGQRLDPDQQQLLRPARRRRRYVVGRHAQRTVVVRHRRGTVLAPPLRRLRAPAGVAADHDALPRFEKPRVDRYRGRALPLAARRAAGDDLRTDAGEGRNFPPRRDITVMCVTEDSHRNIWVGTRHGLFRYNASDNSFTRFTVADGLPNDFVYGILEDELARLWISTNNGMACFDTRKNSFRRYTLRDGIANNQFNLYSYCRSRDGIFWFGGIGGITWFRPHDLVDNPFAPEPQITGVDVADADGDRRVRIERDSAGRVTAAAFPSVRNIFTVRFVAVNPLAGGCNTFAYKLEGFNTRWYETSHLEVNYSNLKPGHYVFKVRAANNDGRWNDEPATVEIRVLPMWWQTLAAKILWALLALGFVGGVVAALLGRMKMKMQLRAGASWRRRRSASSARRKSVSTSTSRTNCARR